MGWKAWTAGSSSTCARSSGRARGSGGDLPPFTIFHDTTLRDLARQRPTNLARMRAVQGIGEKRLADLGQQLLDAITTYCRNHKLPGSTRVTSPSKAGHRPLLACPNAVRDAAFALV